MHRLQKLNRALRGMVAIFLVAIIAVSAVQPVSAAPNYSQIMADEAYWISTAQIPTQPGRKSSGAIAVHKDASNGKWRIRPYDANVAARGMLAGGAYYHPMVKAWMMWYLDHMDDYWPDYNGLHGTVYDYYVDSTTYAETLAEDQSNGTVPFYDSTDAYAATFLTLAKEYSIATGDNAFLQANQYKLNAIGDVIQATKDTDNLTWAKPDWQVKYLMDNTEAYQGISARAWLNQNVFNDPTGASYYTTQANQVKTAVQNSMWKSAQGMYSPAKHSSGAYDTPSWSQWDPASTSQVYPIHTGIIAYNNSRAVSLWNAFNASNHWPNWTATNANPDSRPWMTVCYTASVMRNKTRADSCLTNAITHWTGAPGRPWPWTVLESGMMGLAAKQTSVL